MLDRDKQAGYRVVQRHAGGTEHIAQGRTQVHDMFCGMIEDNEKDADSFGRINPSQSGLAILWFHAANIRRMFESAKGNG